MPVAGAKKSVFFSFLFLKPSSHCHGRNSVTSRFKIAGKSACSVKILTKNNMLGLHVGLLYLKFRYDW